VGSSTFPDISVKEGDTVVVENPLFTDNEFKREEEKTEEECSQFDESYDATNN
jgi:hypothetical protein